MQRICGKCKQAKDLEKDFYKAKGYRGGYLPRCKQCVREYPSQQPAQMLDRCYQTRRRNLRFVWDYYKTHPCIDCGETDPMVLQFDHVRGKKTKIVSKMVHHTHSIKRIQEEIAKCEVVCANCHARRTAKTFGWYAEIE